MATGTISQRISLEGAEEIRRILAEVGQTGEKAFAQIARSAATTQASLRGVEAEFVKLAVATKAFGAAVSGMQSNFNAIGSAVRSSVTTFGILSAAVVAAGAALGAFGVSAARAADDIAESAAAVGLSVTEYQKLQLAASDAGLSEERFAQGLVKLSKAAEDADKAQRVTGTAAQQLEKRWAAVRKVFDGVIAPIDNTGRSLAELEQAARKLDPAAKDSSNAFIRFGISVRDSSGQFKSQTDLLRELAVEIAKMPEGIERTRLIVETFGARGGQKWVNVLLQGEAAMKRLGDALQRVGLLITEQETALGDRASRALLLLGTAADKARIKLGLVFSPLIERAANALTVAIANSFGSMEEFAHRVEATVAPIIADVIALLSGRRDRVQTQWILDVADAFTALGQAISFVFNGIIVPAFKAFVAAAGVVASVINSLFGTQVTGQQVAFAAAIIYITGLFTILVNTVGLAINALSALGAGFVAIRAAIAIAAASGGGLIAFLVALVGWPVLIAAAFAAGFVAVALYFDQIKALAKTTIDAIVAEFNLMSSGIRNIFASLPPALQAIGSQIVDALVTGMRAAFPRIAAAVDAIAAILKRLNIAGPAATVEPEGLAAIQEEGEKSAALIRRDFEGAFEEINVSGQKAAADLKTSFDGTWDSSLRKLDQIKDEAGDIADIAPRKVADIAAKSKPDVGSVLGALGGLAGKGFDEEIRNLLEAVTKSLGKGNEDLAKAIQVLSAELVQAIQSMEAGLTNAINALGNALMSALNKQPTGLAPPQGTPVGTTPGVVPGAAAAPPVDFNAAVASLGAGLVQSITALGTTIGTGIQAMDAGLTQAINALGTTLQGIETGLANSINALGNTLGTSIQSMESAIVNAINQLDVGGGDMTELAHGGQLRGRPGRDTNLGWFTADEFVMQLAAVRKYGINFMRAVNEGRFRMPAFNAGGLVDGMARSLSVLAIPRFADGGLNLAPATAGGRAGPRMTIDLRTDRGDINGLEVTDRKVAEALTRFAIRSQVTATGKSPRWKG